MVAFYAKWVRHYPIVSLEDGLAEERLGRAGRTDTELGNKIQLVGDDIFVTNTELFQKGIERGLRIRF
jgi:enolase